MKFPYIKEDVPLSIAKSGFNALEKSIPKKLEDASALISFSPSPPDVTFCF